MQLNSAATKASDHRAVVGSLKSRPVFRFLGERAIACAKRAPILINASCFLSSTEANRAEDYAHIKSIPVISRKLSRVTQSRTAKIGRDAGPKYTENKRTAVKNSVTCSTSKKSERDEGRV